MNRLFRLLHVFLCLTSLIVASAIPAAPPPPAAVAHLPGQGMALEISKSTPALTSISMQSPDISVATYTVGYENFQAFSIEGEAIGPVEGSPAVPMISRFYRIPNTGGVDLVINNAEYETVDNINPLPFQEEYEADGLARKSFVYMRDEWYPAQVAEISEPMIMRDFRIVRVVLYPVQVNPVTHQARLYHNLSVDVAENGLPGENELTQTRRPSAGWASMYRAYISNLDDDALDDMTTTPGGYMIIANSSNSGSRSKADTLAEWKTRRGFKVVVNSRSNWNSTTIYNAIHDAYATWTNPPLEYVCLMGATSIIPDDNGSDHRYASMTSDDLEDLGVGRFSGSSDTQLAIIMAKTMAYERTPRMESSPGVADTLWYHKALLAGCTDNNCASNYTLMQWGASQFRQFTGVNTPEAIALPSCPGTSECIQRFNQGIGYFIWRGTMMQNIGGVGEANPNGRFPVSVTITCGSANAAQTLITAGTVGTPKGTVTAMGTLGTGTHNPENVTVAGGFVYNVADLGVEHVGDATAGAKAQLYLSSQVDPGDFTRWNNLLGDPGLSMWTDVPKIFSVTYPPTLNIGARCIDITVRHQGDDLPIADATVCLWKKGADSTWVVGTTNAEGAVVLPVSVNAVGTMLLTVTKRNHKPFLASITCGTSECMPMTSRYAVDDDNVDGTQGNNDGLMNPGETVDLNVHIRNFGTTVAASQVSAEVTCSDPRIIIVNRTVIYPDIAPGDSALGNQAFRIQVSPTLPNGTVVPLSFAITSNSGPTTGLIQLTCVSGDLQYIHHRFSNGNFGPGLTRDLVVTVKNTGINVVSGISGRLESLNPMVTVPTATQLFGDIPSNTLDSNAANPFSVTANSAAITGLQVPLQLILTGDNGFVDTTRFNISIGTKTATDPTGPDAYGYFAFDNTDLNYPLHPVFSYVNISAAGMGENLNLRDIGEKTSTTQIWSTTRVLPFSFKFYGRTYDTLTICSNGWVAFGNQGWYDNFRNYPIPGMQSPDAMIAPYWDDLKTYQQGSTNFGVWAYSDPTNGRYIVQWKAQATNSTTALDFEVILYDSTTRPSPDGNGTVLLQYNQVAMNLPNDQDHEPYGCTIGIQKPGGQVGLQYAFITSYTPGSATMAAGRAILFTTNATILTGNLEGVVRDAGTNQPLPGVLVSTIRSGRSNVTDENGHYRIDSLVVGSYDVMVSKYRFNPDTVLGVIIGVDATTTLDFTLQHPEIQLSVNAIADSAEDEPVQVAFNVVNNGNGPMDYSSRVFFAGDENLTPWDSVAAINVPEMTEDSQILGCEFWNNQWWITGAHGPGGQNVFYRFDDHGNYVDYVPQPGPSTLGWSDMATDGDYLYGSSEAWIIKMDQGLNVVDSIFAPIHPCRAIAYDASVDHFWVADSATDIYEIDRDGNVFQFVANRGDTALVITGLAWNTADASGFSLYVFSRNGAHPTRVSAVNPETHQIRTVTDLPVQAGDYAGGCTITPDWNSALVVFGALMRNAAGCRLEIFEMAFNQSWITINPASAVVAGGSTQPVTMTFNPDILRNNIYRVNAHFTSVGCDTTLILPITLTVDRILSADPQRAAEAPSEYVLFQNYPNPFNPNTEIRFSLPQAAHVELKIFNTLGQLVTTLADEMHPAGSYTLTWNGQNHSGIAMASGLYVYQIKAGNFVSAKKMLLMK
jgi:hypothetical protein